MNSSKLEKGMLVVVAGQGVPPFLEFQYNPEQYSVEKSAEWNRPQAVGAESTPAPQYVSTNPMSVSMDIFFDEVGSSSGDVTVDVATLLLWTRPTPVSLAIGLPQPPVLRFQWGTNMALANFLGFLRNVSVKYTMFRVDGTPIRATCSLQLEEVPLDSAFQNPTSGTPPGMRQHVLTETDSLHSIAWNEYRQARLWRGLAVFNGIDDPLRVSPGTVILVPSAREAARLS